MSNNIKGQKYNEREGNDNERPSAEEANNQKELGAQLDSIITQLFAHK